MNRPFLVIALVIAAFTPFNPATSQEQVSEEAVIEFFATCAAVQSLVAVKMESALAQFIFAEAKWFAEIVDDPAQIEKQMRSIQSGYNDGDVSWQELVDIAEGCSEIKEAFVSSP